jgi:CPSF A subunit region
LTQEERQETLSLVELAKWDRGYSLVNVRTWDDKVITADALRSLDVLRWGTDDGKLSLVARDHGSLWPIAVEVLDSSSVIVAEVSLNLLCSLRVEI